jgi:hypothetical protein
VAPCYNLSAMTTLYETMRIWADGQNALNALPADQRACLEAAVFAGLGRLRLLRSLADLAASFLGSAADQQPWSLIAQEFELDASRADVVRAAAYWQRLMELRHPAPQRRAR